MVSVIHSSAPFGLKGLAVEIECDLNQGLPGITIVGLGAKSIDEAKERVKSALLNSGLKLPRKRVTINLSPADFPKDGSSYDLPIAVAIMAASEQVKDGLNTTAFVGELALDGRIKGVPGIIIHAQVAKSRGASSIIIPSVNTAQAKLIDGIELLPADNLKQVYKHLSGLEPIQPAKVSKLSTNGALSPEVDFADISGQEQAKRALEIAAAGHHNVLMTGPPGTGKTMLAQALIGIMPPLNRAEIIEVTNLYSLARLTTDEILTQRPYRSPHHTASQISIIGGGREALPGEVSLANKGVLFMDELPEYSRSVTEVLRQPLEDKRVDIARASRRIRYPADFMLIATQNPCPCGYYGDEKKACICTAYQITQYQKRISGPLMDRIDIVVEVDRIAAGKILDSNASAETSQAIQERVSRARLSQLKRNRGRTNSQLTTRELKVMEEVTIEAKDLLISAIERLDLSPRASMRSLKVARTIADLQSSEIIDQNHVSEALQFRAREAVLI
ncbi:MAG TPA: YifB family Mg chelatase-like AAA ATPase [Candidatus Saccharimonadales bacterium]